MHHEQAKVTEHREEKGGYRILTLSAPAIAAEVKPGQFIHLHVPHLAGAVLRRPFSVYKAAPGVISLLYKTVGRGTQAMKAMRAGDGVSVMGPLGNGFPEPGRGVMPVLVAGGYGVAPLSFLASRLRGRGIVFIGGRSEGDILCADEFKRLKWQVGVATEDGSAGRRGLVTASLDGWLEKGGKGRRLEYFACGPDGLLKAVADRALKAGANAWLSLDKHMGCGVGACLACVQKIRLADGGVRWARVCREGPVFSAVEVAWD